MARLPKRNGWNAWQLANGFVACMIGPGSKWWAEFRVCVELLYCSFRAGVVYAGRFGVLVGFLGDWQGEDER